MPNFFHISAENVRAGTGLYSRCDHQTPAACASCLCWGTEWQTKLLLWSGALTFALNDRVCMVKNGRVCWAMLVR